MVGRDEDGGDQRQEMSRVCEASEGTAIREKGTSVSSGGNQILAPRTRTLKYCAGCRIAAQTFTEDEFHIAFGGGAIPEGCAKNASSCAILHHRLVQRFAERRDPRPEMVND